MKFYLSKPGEVYEASPFSVSVGDVHCFYTTKDSFPIVITLGNRVCFGAPGSEHVDLLKHIGETQTKSEGRFWKGWNVLTFWDENTDITKENVKLVVDALRKRIGINPSDIRLFLDCAFDEDENGERTTNLIAEMTPEEYLSSNIYGENTKYFWDLYKKKNNLSDENGANVASNGMSTKDIWRHYQNMDESQLRKIVAESVREVLREDSNDSNDAKPILEKNNPLAENRKKIRKIIITESQMNVIMDGERFNIKNVYHVSGDVFDRFEKKNFDYFFFSNKPIDINGSKVVYTCNLSMHKPFVFTEGTSWSYPLWLFLSDKEGYLIPEEDFTPEKYEGYLGCPYEFWEKVYYDQDEYSMDEIPRLVQELNMGYDGVIIKGIQEGNTGLMVDDYIVFSPEQVQIVRKSIR